MRQRIAQIQMRLWARWRARQITRARQRWRDNKWQIRQNHLYILPNRHGFYVGFLILTSFAMGYKVQNNFVLLSVIFLFLVFMLSFVAATRNLQGLILHYRPDAYHLADTPQTLCFALTKPQPAFNIVLASPHIIVRADLPYGATETRVPLKPLPRGIHNAPAIKLQTQFPFGVVRCWAWCYLPEPLIICPMPTEYPLDFYPRTDHINTTRHPDRQAKTADETGDLRGYQMGDALARIDWKRFAATREIMVRDHSGYDGRDVLLAQPAGDYEVGLSYLCGGILVCAKHNLTAIMKLNGKTYRLRTKAQRLEALYALAHA